jgi:hypothetical protein
MLDRTHLSRDVGRWTERLLVDGYCVIPDLLPKTSPRSPLRAR